MILSYNEAVNQFGSEYKLAKAVEEKRIFRHEEGIYSTNQYESELGIVMKKYPKAVLTGEYALFTHGLTNVIPEKYDLATSSKAAKITDERVRQVYVNPDVFDFGIEEKIIDGAKVRIYDKERMLIELLRNRSSIPYDLYKECILAYREIVNKLEIPRIQEYVLVFPKSKMISRALAEEVM